MMVACLDAWRVVWRAVSLVDGLVACSVILKVWRKVVHLENLKVVLMAADWVVATVC